MPTADIRESLRTYFVYDAKAVVVRIRIFIHIFAIGLQDLPAARINKYNVAMKYRYVPQGTCSRLIEWELENGVIKDVRFTGGCHGNLQGIASLIKGMRPEDVVARLEGIRCGQKQTSCPDQLAKALKGTL